MNFDFSEEEQAISDITQQIFEDKVTHEHLRSLTKSGESFDREHDDVEPRNGRTWQAPSQNGQGAS